MQTISLCNSLGDIGRLLIDGDENGAATTVETHGTRSVADIADGVTNDFLDIHIGLGGNLARHDRHAGTDHGLARHAGVAILLQHCIENRIGNAVCYLVGMTFGHRLRGELGSLAHFMPPFLSINPSSLRVSIILIVALERLRVKK